MPFYDIDASAVRIVPPIRHLQANTTIGYPRIPHHLMIGGQPQPTSDEPWRPWFFRRYPPKFTFRETPGRGGGDAIEELKTVRESDQAAIKKKLGLLP
jgi:hypothetical protein